MLKRLITLTKTDNEILTSSVIDVVDSIKVDLNTGMDNDALNKLFMISIPGIEIPYSKLPYISEKYLVTISGNGVISYYPEASLIIDFDIKYYDNESYLAIVDETGKILVHSKYVYDAKGNSGKGVLVANKNYKEPTVIVPDLGQKKL